MVIYERAFAISYYVEPGGLLWTSVLNLALPPQRHRPDTQPEHQDPVSHTAQKKREKEKKRKRKGKENEKNKDIKIKNFKKYKFLKN